MSMPQNPKRNRHLLLGELPETESASVASMQEENMPDSLDERSPHDERILWELPMAAREVANVNDRDPKQPSRTTLSKAPHGLPQGKQRDQRFYQLLDLAKEGDAEAKADLWREYSFDVDRDEP